MAQSCGAPTRLAEVVAELHVMWRMTVAWQGNRRADGGLEVAALAVWDCGLEGYWLREAPSEPIREGEVDERSTLRVRRTTAKGLWQSIADLLPGDEQLIDVDESRAEADGSGAGPNEPE